MTRWRQGLSRYVRHRGRRLLSTDASFRPQTNHRGEKPSLNLMRVDGMPILDQLRIEEALYRANDENWCVVNRYEGPPAIVLGISGKPEKLVELDRVKKDNIPLIRRFTGGGTVILSPGSCLVSFVARKDCLADRQADTPDRLMRWSADFYCSVFEPNISNDEVTFSLTAHDYTLGARKIGGNAQALGKDRWVHHTSFLWDFEPRMMEYLSVPEKQPEYRSNRTHADFLTKMSDHLRSQEDWWRTLEDELYRRFDVNIVSDLSSSTNEALASARASGSLRSRTVDLYDV